MSSNYCHLSGCDCKTEKGDLFCSEYCKQAALHAPERDYCQCGHGSCVSPIPLDQALFQYQLNDAIFVSPGQVTIQCTTFEQLAYQLDLLSKVVREQPEDLRRKIEPAPTRRPAASQSQPPLASAKTA